MKRLCSNFSKSSFLPRLLVVILAASTVGCGGGPETGAVQGVVMLGDQPFGDASLVLVSKDSGQGGSSELAPDGTFKLEMEIPVGTYTAYLTPKVDEEEMMQRMQQGLPPSTDKNSKLPKKYQNEASSDLTVTVESGTNEITLRMQP
jgi:hypothetical protein